MQILTFSLLVFLGCMASFGAGAPANFTFFSSELGRLGWTSLRTPVICADGRDCCYVAVCNGDDDPIEPPVSHCVFQAISSPFFMTFGREEVNQMALVIESKGFSFLLPGGGQWIEYTHARQQFCHFTSWQDSVYIMPARKAEQETLPALSPAIIVNVTYGAVVYQHSNTFNISNNETKLYVNSFRWECCVSQAVACRACNRGCTVLTAGTIPQATNASAIVLGCREQCIECVEWRLEEISYEPCGNADTSNLLYHPSLRVIQTAPAPTAASSSSNALNTGDIVAIVEGGVIFILLLVILTVAVIALVFWWRRSEYQSIKG